MVSTGLSRSKDDTHFQTKKRDCVQKQESETAVMLSLKKIFSVIFFSYLR